MPWPKTPPGFKSSQAAARVYLGPVGQAQYWRAHRRNPACSDSVMCTLLELTHCHWRKSSCTPAVKPRSGANPEMQGHHHLTTHLPFPGSLTTTFLSPWDSHMLTPKLTLFPWMHYPFPSGELDMIPLPLLPCSLKTFMKITGMKVKRIPEF